MRTAIVTLVAVLALLVAPAAWGQSVSPCAAGCDPLPPLGWEGTNYQAKRVELPSRRTGAVLRGTVIAPKQGARPHGQPGIVLIPGSMNLAREENYHYAARELASHGYVVLGVDPQGVGRSDTFGEQPCEPDQTLSDTEYPYPCKGVPFQQLANFNDAGESGIDFLLSAKNPFRALVDADQIGLAGHSLGSASVGDLQESDPRVKAVVGWDTLHADWDGVDQCGEMGWAIGGHVPPDGEYRPLVARVPGLALVSNLECPTYFYDDDPDNRKRGYTHFREAGLPSMAVVFQNAAHGDFGQLFYTTAGSEEDHKLQRIEWYTRAWFDLFLRRDKRAVDRLLAPSVVGQTLDQMLHTKWRSAVYLPDQGVHCEDLRQCAAIGGTR